jgi:hypothetical protein
MKNRIIYTNVEWFSATDEPEKRYNTKQNIRC